METNDFVIDGKEYTLVDTYQVEIGTIIQLNSDEDILLLLQENNKETRRLTTEEEQKFREEHNIIENDYVTATARDIFNFEFSTERMSQEKEEEFKKYFLSKLAEIDIDLENDPYVKNRVERLRYNTSKKGNAYALNSVYYFGDFPKHLNSWILFHETVHGIVNYSRIPSKAIVEGITDRMVGLLLPHGNYSRSQLMVGGKIQVNDSNIGQRHLIPFARQLEFGLGENFDLYEMFTHPHKQIHKFAEMYGRGNNRVLLHKITKLYYDMNIETLKDAQDYMLRMIFEKKLENVTDIDSAKKYFKELIDFGLVRARIDERDDALKAYYQEKLEQLKQKGLDISNIPEYEEKPFYPNGDLYSRLGSYIKSSEKAIKEGKIKTYKILYNNDKSSVYIITDGKLSHIQKIHQKHRRGFIKGEINDENSKVEVLENGNYQITSPDGITEEAITAYTNEELQEMFEEDQQEEKIPTKNI